METSFNSAKDSEEPIELDPIDTELRLKRKGRRLTINVSESKYPVVRTVATKMLQWRVSRAEDDENWDLWWSDGATAAEKFSKMKPY
jgi:hypothetical protein